MGNSQNELLSVHKINQAWPGAPEDTENTEEFDRGRRGGPEVDWSSSSITPRTHSRFSLCPLCSLCLCV